MLGGMILCGCCLFIFQHEQVVSTLQQRINDYDNQIKGLSAELDDARAASNENATAAENGNVKSPGTRKTRPRTKAGSSEMAVSVPLRSSARSKLKH